jgi:hypothetical protein
MLFRESLQAWQRTNKQTKKCVGFAVVSSIISDLIRTVIKHSDKCNESVDLSSSLKYELCEFYFCIAFLNCNCTLSVSCCTIQCCWGVKSNIEINFWLTIEIFIMVSVYFNTFFQHKTIKVQKKNKKRLDWNFCFHVVYILNTILHTRIYSIETYFFIMFFNSIFRFQKCIALCNKFYQIATTRCGNEIVSHVQQITIDMRKSYIFGFWTCSRRPLHHRAKSA